VTVYRADAPLAVRAPAMLAPFNAAGVLSLGDVHLARRLGTLTGETDERVLLAVALTSRAVRAGSVCLSLADRASLAVPEAEDGDEVGDLMPAAASSELALPDEPGWVAAIEASPMVAVGVNGSISNGSGRSPVDADRPVRWVDGRLYLDRYWRDEQLVRAQVDARLADLVPGVDPVRLAAALARLFPQPGDARQRLAAASAALSRLTVLTGGPGTGKTTTVARLLAVLQAVAGPGLRVALAAPTGKAAARLQEAVRAEVAGLEDADRARVGLPEASTVHRLLGWRPGYRTRFRHDRTHHLPHDVVVVDETSMVSLPLMARLVEALRPQARLVLVGDPDQLASVEAGAVLGDLVARPPVVDLLPGVLAEAAPGDLPDDPADRLALRNAVVRLDVVHRHGTVIGDLARAVQAGLTDQVIDILRAGHAEISFVETTADLLGENEIRDVRVDAEQAGLAMVHAARAGDVHGALDAVERHRLLLAHRRGRFGVSYWGARVEGWVRQAEAFSVSVSASTWAGSGRPVGSSSGPWYVGRPLLVTTNDRDSGLYNGDVGVIVAQPELTARSARMAGFDGAVVAAFGDPDAPHLVRPHRLPPVETVHAMTVHRAQGSQFVRVSVLLPPADSPLLTRELLYTALTRARDHVRIVGSEQAVRAAVGRPVRRASGLRFG
jgi:exodeoxyribonuclease V alpha subunit